MNIIFYAGSLRPGGGLTVAKIMIEAMAEDKSNHIVVYTGAKDSSRSLEAIFKKYQNVQERPFFQRSHSEVRYLFSKFYFLPKSLFDRKTLLISVNYYIPVFCNLFVYHLNLLSFMRQKGDGFSKKIKEFDAFLACRFATLNVFESDYLKETAEKYTGIKIRNPRRLYIGVDPEFYLENNNVPGNAKILLVSSPQPHKDNPTCIDVLKELYDKYRSVNWELTIVGGQSVEQWSELKSYARSKGVVDNICFLGPINKKELSTLMGQSLCLISASKIESFCMVALESMAAGCPAIVTNETSMPESVGDAAIVVEAGAVDQFSRAIFDIYTDKGYRESLVLKGRERAKGFTYESFSKNLMNIIN